jgi:uncharacterized protein YegP (UPF0339 family)
VVAAKYVLEWSGNQYKFELIADDKEILLTSQRYMTEVSARDGIRSAQINSRFDSNYERKHASEGQLFYFVLKASNGEPIGTSGMYTTPTARENGIRSCMTNGPTTAIEDQT